MIPCKDCGVIDDSCFSFCDCAKCVNEFKYEEWKKNNPMDYKIWLSKNE